MSDIRLKTIHIGQTEIHLETGKIAKQANGAVVVRQNDTLVLVAVTCATEASENLDFFPLTVEYRERAAAGGMIPGGFTRRETRAADHEILAARIIDRSIRPLFPKEFKKETQVMATVLSADQSADPVLLSLIGASAALGLSDIPWNGPLICARVSLIDGTYVLFPGLTEIQKADLTLVVSIGKQGLVMVEGEAREVTESELFDALITAEDGLRGPLNELEQWCQTLCSEKREIVAEKSDDILLQQVVGPFEKSVSELFGQQLTKKERHQRYHDLVEQTVHNCGTEDQTAPEKLPGLLEEMYHSILRKLTIQRKIRLDGRAYQDIRPITIDMGWLPRSHGSAIFTRGETQALVSCSLGTARDEQIVETLFGIEKKRFMLHYNFPPYSVGEIRAMRGPGRREIGHGALAARALEKMLPDYEAFPYTIRIVSDISESNGSSSMATVCGGCLSLYDAGVPLERTVAGIAMGLIIENDDYAILSDILGDEDHYGDMDFKVAGTSKGITAVQMDNKRGSLDREVLQAALEQARHGRLTILQAMDQVISSKPHEISAKAPRVLTCTINVSRIRDLIGPGGKNIQEIQQQTKSKIEVDENGLVRIYAENQDTAQQALKRVKYLTSDVEIGKVYRGEVQSVKNFGVFVKISPHAEGLVHISKLDQAPIANIDDFVKAGETMMVRVLGVDERGKIRLSRVDALKYSDDELGFAD